MQEQLRAEQERLEAELLAAPDARILTTETANGGQVSFVVSEDLNRAMFIGAGLPDAGPGKRYQLWTLETPESTPVPDNQFDAGPDQETFFRGDIADQAVLASASSRRVWSRQLRPRCSAASSSRAGGRHRRRRQYGCSVSGRWQAVRCARSRHRTAARATLDKRRGEVAAMFDRVAARYDLANDVLSLGQDRAWRRRTVEAVEPRPGQRILDLAAGTGTSSEPFAAAGATVVPDRPVARHAEGRQAAPAGAELRRRRRAPAAVRRRQFRRGDHLLRAAQRRGPAAALRELRRVTRPRRHAGRLRVLHPDLGAVPDAVRQLPGRGHPPDRPADLVQPGRL